MPKRKTAKQRLDELDLRMWEEALRLDAERSPYYID